MSDNEPPSVHAAAVEIVREVTEATDVAVDGTTDIKAVAVALERDLKTQAERPADDHDRLAAVETQTQALAQAVIAITSPDKGIAPAVEAVKASMKRRAARRNETKRPRPSIPSEDGEAIASAFLELERLVVNGVNFRTEYQAFTHAYIAFGGHHPTYAKGFAAMTSRAKRIEWTKEMRLHLVGEGVILPPKLE
jgi:hypothetical protein